MNRVDKLFKNKLDDHQLAPSPKAWDALERKLSKKNKTIIWLRVAAVLALATVLTFALLRWNTTEPAQTLTEATTPVKQQDATEQKALEQEPNLAPDENVQAPNVVRPKRSLKQSIPAKENLVAQVVDSEPAQLAVKEITVETPDEVLPVVSTEKKPVVIVYTLPTRVAREPQAQVVAATEDEQKGIQKIWEAAKEVKNSDNPWGDLREAKNELFALEFRKDKNRNQ